MLIVTLLSLYLRYVTCADDVYHSALLLSDDNLSKEPLMHKMGKI